MIYPTYLFHPSMGSMLVREKVYHLSSKYASFCQDFLSFLPNIPSQDREKESMKVGMHEKTVANDISSGYVAEIVEIECKMSGTNATFYLAETITIMSNNKWLNQIV